MVYLPSWDIDQFKLDENFSLTRPSPRTLLTAGWKLTKDPAKLPIAPGVYIIHGGGDGCLDKYLYVGQASHLRNRLYKHPQWKRASLEYFSSGLFYWDFATVKRRDLLRYESYMISMADPLWNFGKGQETVFSHIASFNNLWD